MYYKIVKSGITTEVIEHQFRPEKPIKSSFKHKQIDICKSEQDIIMSKNKNRVKAMSRARIMIRRNIQSNAFYWRDNSQSVIHPLFITLSFKENITDVSKAYNYLNKFLKRLNYNIFKNKKLSIKYLSVIDFQARGAIHFHIIFFNVLFKFKNTIIDLWKLGNANCKFIYNRKYLNNIMNYMIKKVCKPDKRLVGIKSYTVSAGLIKPIIITDQLEATEYVNNLKLQDRVFIRYYNSEYLGKTVYSVYKKI